jgi:hypothetical protein
MNIYSTSHKRKIVFFSIIQIIETFQKLTYQRLIDNSFNVNVKEYRENNE